MLMVILGQEIHKTPISHKYVLILTSQLPLGLTRGYFSLWFPLMFCDYLSYYKGINIKRQTLKIGKYSLR